MGSLVPRPFLPHREKLVWWTAYFVFIPCGFKNVCRNVNIWHHVKCGTTVAHDNAILRHFVAKMVFPGGSDRQETTILEINTCVSDKETLEQSCWHLICPFELSSHPNRSGNSRRPSRDLLHAASITRFSWLPLSCNTSLSQSNLIGLPTFRRRERERNRPFTRPIFPVWRNTVWEWD